MGPDEITIRRTAPGDAPLPPDSRVDRRPAIVAPGLLVLAIAVVVGIFEGGYTRTTWHTLGLFLLALLVIVLLVAPPARGDRSRPFELAMGCFGAFTAWSYLSILWADVPGDAWEGANRTLVYWLALILVGLRPWPARAGRWALMLVTFGLTAVAAGMLAALVVNDAPIELFLEGRLSEPIGYANATANLWMIGLWPALHLAVARDAAWYVRGLALASATVLLEIALLSQSRGAAAAFIVTAVVFVVLHPRHWSVLAALAVPVAALWLGWTELTSIRNADSFPEFDAALADARRIAISGAAIAFVLGSIAALAEARLVRPRLRPDPRRARIAERTFLGLAAVGFVVLFVGVGLSGNWIEDRWDDFRSGGYANVEDDRTRFTGALGSNRYDFYRVAWNEFADHPVTGIGTENFAVPYLQQRRSGEAPRYPHSLAFSVLAMLGIVGTVLLIAFLVSALAPAVRTRMRGSAVEQGVVVACLGGFTAWFTHAMVDWLWEYPALTILGLSLLVVACRTVPDTQPEPSGVAGPTLRSLGVRVVIGVLAVAAAASLALPGASARYERSASKAGLSPQTRMERYARAADLDPLAADPLIARAVVARNTRQAPVARADLQEALRREAKNWFAWFELALLEGQLKRWGAADRAIARARELNPRQPLLKEAAEVIRRRRTVDPLAYERAITGQLSRRLQPFE